MLVSASGCYQAVLSNTLWPLPDSDGQNETSGCTINIWLLSNLKIWWSEPVTSIWFYFIGLRPPWPSMSMVAGTGKGSPAWTALEMMQDLSKCLSQLYSNQEYIIGITSLMASQVSASFVTCTHRFEPYRWRPCGVTWDSSRTVVVIKLRRTSALVKWLP